MNKHELRYLINNSIRAMPREVGYVGETPRIKNYVSPTIQIKNYKNILSIVDETFHLELDNEIFDVYPIMTIRRDYAELRLIIDQGEF